MFAGVSVVVFTMESKVVAGGLQKSLGQTVKKGESNLVWGVYKCPNLRPTQMMLTVLYLFVC